MTEGRTDARTPGQENEQLRRFREYVTEGVTMFHAKATWTDAQAALDHISALERAVAEAEEKGRVFDLDDIGRVIQERDAFQQENHRLLVDLSSARRALAERDEFIARLEQDMRQQTSTMAEAHAALKRYGVHDPECGWQYLDSECTCGLSKIDPRDTPRGAATP